MDSKMENKVLDPYGELVPCFSVNCETRKSAFRRLRVVPQGLFSRKDRVYATSPGNYLMRYKTAITLQLFHGISVVLTKSTIFLVVV